MQFSKRMERFGSGIFSVLLEQKNEVLKKGGKIVDLSIGTPNIPPAPHIMQALIDSASDPKNYVYAIKDSDALLQAVAAWYKRRYGVSIDPAHEAVSLLGSQDGLAHLALSIADAGDTVLVPDPCYPIFADGPALAGARLVYMPLKEENDYLIDFDAIDPEDAKKAKLMVVSYPNNPTAAAAPDWWYDKLVAFAKKYDIIVLHDNAYSELAFDGLHCGSFLAHEGAKEVGVEFNSLSKTYGLAGARIGFCIGNEKVVSMFSQLKSNLDYGMFLPVQAAAIAAITGDQACVETTREAYCKRRDILCDGLTAIGWPVKRSAATMFVWAKLPDGYTDSVAFSKLLLDKTGVLVTPGAAFGPSGEGHVRMALVQSDEEVLWAIDSIKKSGILNK